jgi:hypothetical protein
VSVIPIKMEEEEEKNPVALEPVVEAAVEVAFEKPGKEHHLVGSPNGSSPTFLIYPWPRAEKS